MVKTKNDLPDLFTDFVIGKKYRLVGMTGIDYYDFSGVVERTLFDNNIYELIQKDNSTIVFEWAMKRQPSVFDFSNVRLEFVLNLESGKLDHYNFCEDVSYNIVQGLAFENSSVQCVWISTDANLVELDDTSMENLISKFDEGMLIVPFGEIELESL